jgi:hypothetical protein
VRGGAGAWATRERGRGAASRAVRRTKASPEGASERVQVCDVRAVSNRVRACERPVRCDGERGQSRRTWAKTRQLKRHM